MASQAKFVSITLADGTTQTGILLDQAEGGEGSTTPLVFVMNRDGSAIVVEAAAGADADSFVEA